MVVLTDCRAPDAAVACMHGARLVRRSRRHGREPDADCGCDAVDSVQRRDGQAAGGCRRWMWAGAEGAIVIVTIPVMAGDTPERADVYPLGVHIGYTRMTVADDVREFDLLVVDETTGQIVRYEMPEAGTAMLREKR
jgi:hypothetical protein